MMTTEEKAALRNQGERYLEALETLFEEALRESNLRKARRWEQEYCGAAKMLEQLQLISREEYVSRTETLFSRYMAALCPTGAPREDAG